MSRLARFGLVLGALVALGGVAGEARADVQPPPSSKCGAGGGLEGALWFGLGGVGSALAARRRG
jgi:hypothetical protein